MILRFCAAALFLGLSAAGVAADSDRTKAPPGAQVYFIAPVDGATVFASVTVTFGLKGLGVAPAGTDAEKTGHHHLLIDQKLEDYDSAIPSDEKHVHFGGGQTETTIQLSPGKHTLQLVVGDLNHVPHSPPIESKAISITVK